MCSSITEESFACGEYIHALHKRNAALCIPPTEAYRSGHNEAVLKTVWGQPHGGSNPSASAKTQRGHLVVTSLCFDRW